MCIESAAGEELRRQLEKCYHILMVKSMREIISHSNGKSMREMISHSNGTSMREMLSHSNCKSMREMLSHSNGKSMSTIFWQLSQFSVWKLL